MSYFQKRKQNSLTDSCFRFTFQRHNKTLIEFCAVMLRYIKAEVCIIDHSLRLQWTSAIINPEIILNLIQ